MLCEITDFFLEHPLLHAPCLCYAKVGIGCEAGSLNLRHLRAAKL